MRIIKVDPLNPEIESMRIACNFIKNGKIVAFPTETVYGLGADAFNASAIERLFQIKRRPKGNPLIIHISSFTHLDEIIENIEDWQMRIIKKFWPGPVTFIFKKKVGVPDIVTGGLDTVAVRMPSHPVSSALIRLTGPLVAPSANLSGKPSPTKAEHVLEDFKEEVDMIVDGGETIFGIESSIIDFSSNNPILIRPGPITVERLKSIIPNLKVDVERIPSSSFDHYITKKPLYLFAKGSEEMMINDILDFLKKERRKVLIICTDETKDLYPENIEKIVMGSRKSIYSIARNVFDILRKADHTDTDLILMEGVEEKGIGYTIMDRLRKAAVRIFE